MYRINYQAIIQEYFLVKNKQGELQPFIFNDTQQYYHNLLKRDYPTMQGIRENVLKSRQPGFSTYIDALFAVDFIMSEMGHIPIIDSDIISYVQEQTLVLFDRVQLFLESWAAKVAGIPYEENQDLIRKQLRAEIIDTDQGRKIIGKRGAQIHVQTAGAKVSGRGGTKQNVHESEVAFFPNTEILDARKLVTGLEEQVPMGYGKIFRESTGNTTDDFFSEEFEAGLQPNAEFKSRFLGWYIHKEYSIPAPHGWEPPKYYDDVRKRYGATIDQCYRHFVKTKGLTDKLRMRENPTYPEEAFLMGGDPYFSSGALQHYQSGTRTPLMEAEYVSDIQKAL